MEKLDETGIRLVQHVAGVVVFQLEHTWSAGTDGVHYVSVMDVGVRSGLLAPLNRAVCGLDAAVVARLLGSCDRATVVGRRDYAILLVLARLGLRGGEVAGLELGDIDWRSGEVTVRGKAERVDRLPLPVDVGEAMVAYLADGRPACAARSVFCTVRAPYRPLTPAAIRQVMGWACRRAGLPRVGAHRLRHTLATDMLRAGASLPEVGQVLRHRSDLSTAIYAKVDESALRPLARPWPMGARS